MAAKLYAIVVTFPKAPAGIAQQEIRESGNDPSVAVSRAIKKAIWAVRRKTKHRNLATVGRVTWQQVEEAKTASSPEAAAEVQQ